MSSRRLLKAAAAVREVVSMSILTELRDPRVQDVTVTFVEVAPDMRSAKVHVSIMGNDSKQNLALRGLQRSAGFLQAKIAERIDTRYTPRLEFVLDKGVKNSIAVSQILQEVLPPAEDSADPESLDDSDDSDDSNASDEPDDSDASGDRENESIESTTDIPSAERSGQEASSPLPPKKLPENDSV
jgi:ribosome-binding factor A